MKVPFSSQSKYLFCWLRTKRPDVLALEKAENIRQSYYCGILNVCSLVYMRLKYISKIQCRGIGKPSQAGCIIF